MIDFKNIPTAKKSEEEIEFERLNDLYFEKFGKRYGFFIGFRNPSTWKEAIEDIQRCLDTGVEQKMPDIKPGVVY